MLAVFAFALYPGDALAWGPTGHMIVASLAYDQLPQETRDKWVALLKQHPDFPKWQATKPTDEPNLDFGRYLFMRASNWPDEIRKSGSVYDHPVWHYIDYPLQMPACPLEAGAGRHGRHSLRPRPLRENSRQSRRRAG